MLCMHSCSFEVLRFGGAIPPSLGGNRHHSGGRLQAGRKVPHFAMVFQDPTLNCLSWTFDQCGIVCPLLPCFRCPRGCAVFSPSLALPSLDSAMGCQGASHNSCVPGYRLHRLTPSIHPSLPHRGGKGGGLFEFQPPPPPLQTPPKFSNPSFSNLRFVRKGSAPKAPKFFFPFLRGYFLFYPTCLYPKYSEFGGKFKKVRKTQKFFFDP